MNRENKRILYQPPTPNGVRGPGIFPPGFLCHPCCQGLAWGSGDGTHGRDAWGWRGMIGPRYVKCVHFQRRRREINWVLGWPWKEGLVPCLSRQHPPPGYGLHEPFPHDEGREPREGGRKLPDPIKGQKRLALCLEISA